MAGRKSKQKGSRGEAEFVDALNSTGLFRARKQPLSGSLRDFPDDIREDLVFCGTCEVKNRESIGKYLWKWLGLEIQGRRARRVKDVKALLLKRNWHPRLVVMTLDEFTGLVRRLKEQP